MLIERLCGFFDQGIFPVPVEERKDRQFYKVFFVWFSANFNVLSYVCPLRQPFTLSLIIVERFAQVLRRYCWARHIRSRTARLEPGNSVLQPAMLYSARVFVSKYIWVLISSHILTDTTPISTTWGPKLGMRQMCQARYSFGCVCDMLDLLGDVPILVLTAMTLVYECRYYGVMLPSFLNLLSMIGFSVLSCILGGQTLAAVTPDTLSWK